MKACILIKKLENALLKAKKVFYFYNPSVSTPTDIFLELYVIIVPIL